VVARFGGNSAAAWQRLQTTTNASFRVIPSTEDLPNADSALPRGEHVKQQAQVGPKHGVIVNQKDAR